MGYKVVCTGSKIIKQFGIAGPIYGRLFRNEIYVSGIKLKKNNFHSRFSAKERIYLYIIRNDQSPSTINHNREWNIRNKLDLNLMKKGAKKLVGTHNFSTFRAANCGAKSPIRTIKKIQILKQIR